MSNVKNAHFAISNLVVQAHQSIKMHGKRWAADPNGTRSDIYQGLHMHIMGPGIQRRLMDPNITNYIFSSVLERF